MQNHGQGGGWPNQPGGLLVTNAEKAIEKDPTVMAFHEDVKAIKDLIDKLGGKFKPFKAAYAALCALDLEIGRPICDLQAEFARCESGRNFGQDTSYVKELFHRGAALSNGLRNIPFGEGSAKKKVDKVQPKALKQRTPQENVDGSRENLSAEEMAKNLVNQFHQRLEMRWNELVRCIEELHQAFGDDNFARLDRHVTSATEKISAAKEASRRLNPGWVSELHGDFEILEKGQTIMHAIHGLSHDGTVNALLHHHFLPSSPATIAFKKELAVLSEEYAEARAQRPLASDSGGYNNTMHEQPTLQHHLEEYQRHHRTKAVERFRNKKSR